MATLVCDMRNLFLRLEPSQRQSQRFMVRKPIPEDKTILYWKTNGDLPPYAKWSNDPSFLRASASRFSTMQTDSFAYRVLASSHLRGEPRSLINAKEFFWKLLTMLLLTKKSLFGSINPSRVADPETVLRWTTLAATPQRYAPNTGCIRVSARGNHSTLAHASAQLAGQDSAKNRFRRSV